MMVKVKVIPNAKVPMIQTDKEGNLKVKLKSVPEKGKANKELIEVLASHYDVNKSDVRIVRGMTSRRKTVEVDL